MSDTSNFNQSVLPNQNDRNFAPMRLEKRFDRTREANSKTMNDEENIFQMKMSEMKKKLDYIEKTNWMFMNAFDIHFLPNLDTKLIENQTSVFSIENTRK